MAIDPDGRRARYPGMGPYCPVGPGGGWGDYGMWPGYQYGMWDGYTSEELCLLRQIYTMLGSIGSMVSDIYRIVSVEYRPRSEE